MPDRIAELKAEIAELKKRWPAHSVSPALLQAFDDLEEELAQELAKRKEQRGKDA
jgi:hypothetical protein